MIKNKILCGALVAALACGVGGAVWLRKSKS